MHACVSVSVSVPLCACVCACVRVLVVAASTAPTDLLCYIDAGLVASIRYNLSRIQLPDYKETCHTTNVSSSDAFHFAT